MNEPEDEPELDDFFSCRPRGRAQLDALHVAHRALEGVLRSRTLRPYQFSRRREIGPYVVDYVCCEHSLILELQVPGSARDAARSAFLVGLGYTVLQVSEQEVTRHPGRVLERIRTAVG
jgi:very-short-patch-repair endonuclease